jgi:hypothetical protein
MTRINKLQSLAMEFQARTPSTNVSVFKVFRVSCVMAVAPFMKLSNFEIEEKHFSLSETHRHKIFEADRCISNEIYGYM